MAQDLRDLFKEEKQEKYPMKEGHETRFLNKLEEELPQTKKSSFHVLKIAASVLLLISAGIFGYRQWKGEAEIPVTVVNKDDVPKEDQGLSLGDLSPDLQKVENYYVANINLELSELEVSDDNRALVDGFMERLTALNEEYERLNKELNEVGPNDQTITALIKNLQLRLQLLRKLKEKLNELKSSENEQVTTNTV